MNFAAISSDAVFGFVAGSFATLIITIFGVYLTRWVRRRDIANERAAVAQANAESAAQHESDARLRYLASVELMQTRLARGFKPHDVHGQGRSNIGDALRAYADTLTDPARRSALLAAWDAYGKETHKRLTEHRRNPNAPTPHEIIAEHLRTLRSFAE